MSEDIEKVFIVLTSEETQRCDKFANEVFESTYKTYKDRDSELTPDKAIEHAYRGKCGELAVYNNLVAKNYSPSKVDFEITDRKHHGADMELIGKNILLHIKTCKKSNKSWLFQRNAKYVEKPNANDFFSLVVQHDYDIYEVLPIIHSNDLIFAEPLRPMGSKIAVYYDVNFNREKF